MTIRACSAVLPVILLSLAAGGVAVADTSNVKVPPPVVVTKSGTHCRDDSHCMNRYHPAIEPVARAKPGQYIVFETRDALDSDFDFDSNPDDVAAANLNLVHPLTGPVHIEGAKRGDVLAVTLIDIAPDDYGYTVIVPGFGFLRDLYPDPYIVNWRLTRYQATSAQMPGVAIPFRGFMGTVGVLPGKPEVQAWLEREGALASAGGFVLTPQPQDAVPAAVCGPNGTHKDECLRTIPPRENGGNMDVKQMQVGTVLLLPCFVDGCGLFVGDVHYAQGDGEVSGTAVEMGAKVTVRTEVRKGMAAFMNTPHFEGGDQLKRLAPARFYATTGFPLKKSGEVPPYFTYLDGDRIGGLTNMSEEVTLAARNALVEMIDYLVKRRGLSPQQAYVLSSVAVDLRIAQLVDVPNLGVSAILPLTVFQNE
jgi:formamidase